jgi:hypothetical protein
MKCACLHQAVRYHTIDAFMLLNKLFAGIKIQGKDMKDYKFDGR